VCVLGAAGFAASYVLDAGVRWLGGTVAVALLGLAYGLAAWAALLPEGPFVEPRGPMQSPPEESYALAQELGEADGSIVSAPVPRRALTVALGALGLAALFPLRSLIGISPKTPAKQLATTAWAEGVPLVREDGTPVRADDLEVGTALTVFPKGHPTEGDVGVLLIRADPAELEAPTNLDWTVDGLVAYSKICTHAGCPVGLYNEGTGELLCPCHQSVFDAYRGANPRYGPAARPLPQLPLGVATDGTLIATGGFTTPIGPGYWRTS
jgi:ubiquinol-cytochrome c reductase iron-sulfur subunit